MSSYRTERRESTSTCSLSRGPPLKSSPGAPPRRKGKLNPEPLPVPKGDPEPRLDRIVNKGFWLSGDSRMWGSKEKQCMFFCWLCTVLYLLEHSFKKENETIAILWNVMYYILRIISHANHENFEISLIGWSVLKEIYYTLFLFFY